MKTTLIHSADFAEGYRITRAGDSLFIQATGGCDGPLRLKDRQLAAFGVCLAGKRQVSYGAEMDKAGRLAEERLRFCVLVLILSLAMLLLVPIITAGP
jgi:hypothetical protein